MLVTGIKVIDLICPFIKGGKVGAFGGAGACLGLVFEYGSVTASGCLSFQSLYSNNSCCET